jgi:hypothetical protein
VLSGVILIDFGVSLQRRDGPCRLYGHGGTLRARGAECVPGLDQLVGISSKDSCDESGGSKVAVES